MFSLHSMVLLVDTLFSVWVRPFASRVAAVRSTTAPVGRSLAWFDLEDDTRIHTDKVKCCFVVLRPVSFKTP
jgi:hypothetical protein